MVLCLAYKLSGVYTYVRIHIRECFIVLLLNCPFCLIYEALLNERSVRFQILPHIKAMVRKLACG